MARGVPVQPEQRARAISLHAKGKGRNEIAAAVGISTASVSRIIANAGGSFDRSKTAKAVEAHRIDRAAVRADIIDRMYTRGQKVLARLEADKFAYRVPTECGTEMVYDDDPPAGDEKNLAAALGMYVQNATKLETIDAGTGVEKVHSVLDSIAAGFAAAAANYVPDDGDQ